MEIEFKEKKEITTFADVDIGVPFYDGDGDLMMRIGEYADYVDSHNHDGLAVSLKDGDVMWYDDEDEVTIAKVKVVEI
jgi:hypothetical protein